MHKIEVDEDVKKMILDAKEDYRLCTACYGPALVPISVKMPKRNDVMIPVGDYVLYVSQVQAMYTNRITMDMVYSEEEIESCPAFGPYYNYSVRDDFE